VRPLNEVIMAKEKEIKKNNKPIKTISTPNVNTKDIIEEVNIIALTCYGIKSLADWNLSSMKKTIKPTDAIFINKIGKKYRIKLYVNIISDVKLSEILSETQKRIKYEVEKRFKVDVDSVNVYVQTLSRE
jgi:uncharacterized alkaline shock family protein YloU